MNRLNPQLKQLLDVARKVEQSSTLDCEAPPDFARRVLNRLTPNATISQSSALEFMVQRGAAFAALIGVLTLTIQFSTAKPSIGIFKDLSVPGAVLFRIILR